MWALGPGLFDPLLQTVIACQLGAIRAHHSILNRAKADEAAEHFFKLGCSGRLRTSIPTNPCIDRLDAASAARAASRGQRGQIVVIRIVSLMAPDQLAIHSLIRCLLMLLDLLQDTLNLLLFRREDGLH